MKINYIVLGIIILIVILYFGNNFKEGLHLGDGIKHGGFDEKKSCSACESGYKLSDDTHTCNLVPIPNCWSRDGVFCKDCEDGYQLTEKRNACIPAEFSNCETQEDMVCKKCKKGFKLSWNKKLCLAVPIPRCEKQLDLTCNRCVKPYKLSDNKCDDCDKGFNYENGWCKVAKPGQIQNCEHQKNGICFACRAGYISKNGLCSKPIIQEKIETNIDKDYDLIETTCEKVVCPKGFSSKPENTVCKSEKVKKKPKKVEPQKAAREEIKEQNKKIEETPTEPPVLGNQKNIDVLMKSVLGVEASAVKKAQKELDISPPTDKCPPVFDDASMKKELETQNSTINSLKESLNKLLNNPVPTPEPLPVAKATPAAESSGERYSIVGADEPGSFVPKICQDDGKTEITTKEECLAAGKKLAASGGFKRWGGSARGSCSRTGGAPATTLRAASRRTPVRPTCFGIHTRRAAGRASSVKCVKRWGAAAAGR